MNISGNAGQKVAASISSSVRNWNPACHSMQWYADRDSLLFYLCDCAQLGNEPFELKLLVLSLFLFCWTHYFKKIQINKLFRQTLQIGLFILKSIWHMVGFSGNLIRGEARFQAGSFRLRFLIQVRLENILLKYDSAINSGKMKLGSTF